MTETMDIHSERLDSIHQRLQEVLAALREQQNLHNFENPAQQNSNIWTTIFLKFRMGSTKLPVITNFNQTLAIRRQEAIPFLKFASRKQEAPPPMSVHIWTVFLVFQPYSPVAETFIDCSETFKDERDKTVNESKQFKVTKAEVRFSDGAFLTEHFDWENLLANLEVRCTKFISNVRTAPQAIISTDHLHLWYENVALPSI